ncbi:TPA: hypothetical protein ACH3X1_008269 [Trebouxia sp. C0004]
MLQPCCHRWSASWISSGALGTGGADWLQTGGNRQADDKVPDRAAEGFLRTTLYTGVAFWQNVPFRTQRLPAVADIVNMSTLLRQVMTSHNKADQQAALDISLAMGDILTDMQSCLQQLTGSSMCGDPEAVARLIVEKIAAMNTGSGCEHNTVGTDAKELPNLVLLQQPLQARATATEAMSAKRAQIQTPVLYNTSGSVNTVQLAWREWTCNGGSNTIK